MGFLTGKKFAIFLTILILLVGTLAYFQLWSFKSGLAISNIVGSFKKNNSIEVSQNLNQSNKIDEKLSLFDNLVKEDKLFTKTNGKDLELLYYYSLKDSANIVLEEGNISDYMIYKIAGQNYYPMILGYNEAKNMREEGEFSKLGDPIVNFLGNNFVVIGVLKKTDTIIDDLHITPLSKDQMISVVENVPEITPPVQIQNETNSTVISNSTNSTTIPSNSTVFNQINSTK